METNGTILSVFTTRAEHSLEHFDLLLGRGGLWFRLLLNVTTQREANRKVDHWAVFQQAARRLRYVRFRWFKDRGVPRTPLIGGIIGRVPLLGCRLLTALASDFDGHSWRSRRCGVRVLCHRDN